jgi:hypothetical protein
VIAENGLAWLDFTPGITDRTTANNRRQWGLRAMGEAVVSLPQHPELSSGSRMGRTLRSPGHQTGRAVDIQVRIGASTTRHGRNANAWRTVQAGCYHPAARSARSAWLALPRSSRRLLSLWLPRLCLADNPEPSERGHGRISLAPPCGVTLGMRVKPGHDWPQPVPGPIQHTGTYTVHDVRGNTTRYGNTATFGGIGTGRDVLDGATRRSVLLGSRPMTKME